MRTMKDMVRAAKLIAASKHTIQTKRHIVDMFVEYFRGENPQFDPARFRDACEVPPKFAEPSKRV